MLSFLLSLLGIGRDAARGEEGDASTREPGFKDVLKNPGLLRKVEEFFTQRTRNAEDAKSWSDERVAKAVGHYVFEGSGADSYSPEVQLLASLGTRIHPSLLALLRDESLRGKLVKLKTGDGLPTAPINRVARLLHEVPCVEAVSLLAGFVGEPSEYIRADIGFAIGTAASANALEPLRRLLGDEKHHVAAMTLNGFLHAIRAKRVDARVSQELFPELEKLTRSWNNAETAASVMLAFDRTFATARLTSAEILSPKNDGVGGVLQALIAEQVLAPREQVLSVVDECSKGDGKDRVATHYALHLLGLHRHPDDKARLEAALQHAEERIAEGGAAGLIAWHGLENFEKKIWKALKGDDRPPLTPAQKHWLAVRSYDGEVNNGGHSQYFLNSSGDDWAVALAGLQAMGSTERPGILREAATQFGKQGPAAESDTRRDQLAKIIRRNEEAFGDLDDRYYKSKEYIDVLLARYVLAHAEDFR